jgi:Domain of Unknown Function (DUF928)
MLESSMSRSQGMMMFRLLTGLSLFLWIDLSLVAPTIAQPQVAQPQVAQSIQPRSVKKRWYKPRRSGPPKGQITTTATRGCPTQETAERGKFVALAPVSTPGKTQSLRPTVAWYIPHQTAYGLSFQLATVGTDTPEILYQTDLASSPGMMQLTLPELGLAIGQSYSWRVVLHCKAGSPSADQLVGGEIEIVAPDRAVAPAIGSSQRYAEAGLWYDAFAIAAPQERNQLLADLIELEQTDPADPILKQSEALQKLMEFWAN